MPRQLLSINHGRHGDATALKTKKIMKVEFCWMSKDRLKYQMSKTPIAMIPVAVFFKMGEVYKVAQAYDYKTAKKAVNALKKGKMPQIPYKDC